MDEKCLHFFLRCEQLGEQIISSDTIDNGDEKCVLFQHQRVGVHHLGGVFFDAVVDHHASKIVVT